ncbi:MAG TPA: hypothetical protein PLP21_12160 [Pyrinomonadaceae bacterium]|nr:hypothetical protein [Acidobacteriota bacterium]HQZ97065.1 hypothetical protein [Pyrinomonadaceae bacterium]
MNKTKLFIFRVVVSLARHKRQYFLGLIHLSIIFYFIGIGELFAQSETRRVNQRPWAGQPITIEKVRVKDRSISFQDSFIESEDWLNGFSFQVKNISKKTIVYLDISLVFPQDEFGNPTKPASEVLRFGKFPKADSDLGKIDSNLPTLAPGESVTLYVKSYLELQKLLEYAGHPKNISDVTIRLERVVFSDGTMFSAGKTLTRDPGDPERWRVENGVRHAILQF